MIIDHVFFKESTEVVRESVEKAFGELEPVSKMEPNRFELPITSVRRILGDKFYDLSKSDVDMIRLLICDNGGFNLKDLKTNYDKGNELLQFISMIFQSFIKMNGDRHADFNKDVINNLYAKLCITSTKGLSSQDVTMGDILGPVSNFDDNGSIVSMKNMVEIANITQEIQKVEASLEQIRAMGSNKGVETLEQTRADLTNKLVEYQCGLIDSFFEVIKKYSNTDNITDIFDLAIVFGASYKNPENGETIVETTVLDYHDVASRNVVTLKNKFHV